MNELVTEPVIFKIKPDHCCVLYYPLGSALMFQRACTGNTHTNKFLQAVFFFFRRLNYLHNMTCFN